MCSYNRINGDYACENDYTLNQVSSATGGSRASCSPTGVAPTPPSSRTRRPRYGPARRRQLLLRTPSSRPCSPAPFRRRASTTWSIALCAACLPPASLTSRPCRALSSILPWPRRCQSIEEESLVLLKNAAASFRSPPLKFAASPSSAAMRTLASSPAAALPGRFTRRQRRRPQNGRIRLGQSRLLPFLPAPLHPRASRADAHIAYDAGTIPPRPQNRRIRSTRHRLRHPMDVRRPDSAT